MPDEPNEDDVSKFRPSFFVEQSHAGRVTRVVIGLALTVIGFGLPLPYVGWAYSTIVFVPAGVLFLFATGGKSHRRIYWLAVPTVLGVALSAFSFLVSSERMSAVSVVEVFTWTLGTTLAAVVLGSPRIASWKGWW